MDLMAPIDIYCERLEHTFWAEPINAISNIAFFFAAWLGLSYALRKRLFDWPIGLLVVIALLVGIGSFLFHTFATGWALLSDVIPIQLFIVFYFAFAMRRFAGLPWLLGVLATVVFVGFSTWAGEALGNAAGDWLNGSEGYIPPLAALFVVGAILAVAGRAKQGMALIVGALIFTLSLTFRTLDHTVCAQFPHGTHFLWHLLNGVLLGWLIVAMARYGIKIPVGKKPEAA